jgi:hypothetical protein
MDFWVAFRLLSGFSLLKSSETNDVIMLGHILMCVSQTQLELFRLGQNSELSAHMSLHGEVSSMRPSS